MIPFILNDKEVNATSLPGTTLLDFIRYEKQLPGTKIGCREGDCGACTILIGEMKGDQLMYTSATSCLMPLANARGKHIVTIEGINIEGLTAVQQAFSDEGATQCGFCTPGFIVSLTGHCLVSGKGEVEEAVDSMNGNICRCTGYKSIERAANRISELLKTRKNDPLQFAISQKIIPPYFLEIPQRLQKIKSNAQNGASNNQVLKYLGGGTDLYVQQHDTIAHEKVEFLYDKTNLKGIIQKGNRCEVGASVTVTQLAESDIFKSHFPNLTQYIKLVSSTPIRNMATLAGNFINASPIGDFSIFFLALDATLVLSDGIARREIPLRKLYKGYKTLDKAPQEIVEKVYFELPTSNDLFNFEKVSKRTCLDIASVNTAIKLRMEKDIIKGAGIAAGGVGPIPMFLEKASAFLLGKKVSSEVVHELIEIVMEEIAPISDTRGSADYKRLLLSQLIKAHFIVLFPGLPIIKLMEA